MNPFKNRLGLLVTALLLPGCASFNEVATVLATPFVIVGAVLGIVKVPTPSTPALRMDRNLSSPLCVDHNYAASCRQGPITDVPQVVTVLASPEALSERQGSFIAAKLVQLASPERQPRVLVLHSAALDTDQMTAVGKLVRLINDNFRVDSLTFGADGIKSEDAAALADTYSALFLVQPTGALKQVMVLESLRAYPGGLIVMGRDMAAPGDSTEALTALTGTQLVAEGASEDCEGQPAHHAVTLDLMISDGLPELERQLELGGRLDAVTLTSEAHLSAGRALSNVVTHAPACADASAPQAASLIFAVNRAGLGG